MANKILTKSDKFKSEYCCTVVKINEINPIKGKDRIGWTRINGETIVVNKEQTKVGGIYLYASNETQLNKDFLSANNLFESGCYELNSNANEVEPFAMEVRRYKNEIDKCEEKFKVVTGYIKFLNDEYEQTLNDSDNDADKKIIEKRHQNIRDAIFKRFKDYHPSLSKDDDDAEFVNVCADEVRKLEDTLDALRAKRDEAASLVRAKVGFFNKNCRVRAIKLGGISSQGYLFSIDELAKYNSKVKDVNLEEMLNEDFDTVDGEIFVKAYIPPMPQQSRRKTHSEKRNKKIERFNRMIKGEFLFHYDTDPLKKNISKISPEDVVTLSVKVHGTSACFANVHVKYPIKLPVVQRLRNWLIDKTSLFKNYRIKDYYVDYGNVSSSRNTIKNAYINENAVNGGFYKVDIWTEYGERLYPYLDKGMTVYGEIVGYVTGSESMIQKNYDYGCEVGTNKFMPYRITTTNEDGTKREWEVQEVYDWTINLIENHPEIKEYIMPITILYHGTLSDLYPKVSLTEHWHENIVEALVNDKKHLGMEKDEPMCTFNKVPREGICVRIDNDPIAECFKLKTEKFKWREQKLIDEGEVDAEMMQAY